MEKEFMDESSSDEDEGLSLGASLLSKRKEMQKAAAPASTTSGVKRNRDETNGDVTSGAAAKKKSKKEKKEKKKKKKKHKKKKHKKSKKESSSSSSKRGRSTTRKKSSSTSKSRSQSKKKKPKTIKEVKVKELNQAKLLDRAMKGHRWWLDKELPGKQQWVELEHYGVSFPPDYTPCGVPLLYDDGGKTKGPDVKRAPDGKLEVYLEPSEEEWAYYFAEIAVDGPQLGGKPKIRKQFIKNFWSDFREQLTPKHSKLLKSFEKCDWSVLREHVAQNRAKRKARTKEEKAKEKEAKEAIANRYAYAIIDGKIQRLANYVVEPPGLFRGRGEHPKVGKFKYRVLPEQITMNVGFDQPVPRCHVPGHSWQDVIHSNTATYLATWIENVNGQNKYTQLAASSFFKGRSDIAKYEKARLLKKYIGKIRKNYEKGLKSKTKLICQRSTCMWIIDKLALRVGNEKDEDEADTVGCCSLRVEHLFFNKDPNDGTPVLKMHFLGKDSMEHNQDYNMSQYGEIGTLVYNNLKKFCSEKKKTKDSDVFDEVDPSELNSHLKTLMPGLSAKVFRTYNASITLQEQLPRSVMNETAKAKEALYKAANKKVAILCNHQKTVSAKWDENFQKVKDKNMLLQKQLEGLRRMKELVKSGKKVKLKKVQTIKGEYWASITDPERKKKEKAEYSRKRQLEAHRFSRQPSLEDVVMRIGQWEKKLADHTHEMKMKDDNKTVALGTSKINYMDPRITVAWLKENELPIEKVFASKLRDKFPWAMSVPPMWRF
eukprot:g1085.t1